MRRGVLATTGARQHERCTYRRAFPATKISSRANVSSHAQSRDGRSIQAPPGTRGGSDAVTLQLRPAATVLQPPRRATCGTELRLQVGAC